MASDLALKIYSLSEAQASILKRRAIDAYDIPPSMVQRSVALFGEPVEPEEAVRRILKSVREQGDSAVQDWTARIDGATLTQIAVSESEIEAAIQRIPADIYESLQFASNRIRQFHQMQPAASWQENGLGQLVRPIRRVGVYVPGGTAPLPSSLLMCAIPAQVAGVKEIVVCTPPDKEGNVPDVILAAANICGIEKIYRVGGAQAIGALAFGTESIPRVDKIVGPGNLFVTLAKRQVFGNVGIDGLPGPTETMIIADEGATPSLAAADLLAQAEHDVLAGAILVTPSRQLAEAVAEEVETQLGKLSRAEIARQALANQGGIVLVENLEEAFAVNNAFAPEHLCLLIENPEQWIDCVENAGGVFVGEGSFEVLGDYVAGPSHVMPTSGTARFASPLNVWDFVKITSLIGFDDETASNLSPSAAKLAHAEGLTAHAAAAEARIRE